jgi:hypothetical protein
MHKADVPAVPASFPLQLSVLDHKEREVTVETRISTTNAPSAQQQQEDSVSCGDFFVAVGDGTCSSWYYQI